MKNISAVLNSHQGLLALLGIVASFLIAITPGLSSDWMKLPERQREINTAVIFTMCMLVLSIVIDSWYARTWGWLGGLSVSTAASRAALVQSGKDEVEKRVAAERRAAQLPVWRLRKSRDWGGEEDIFILYNCGAPVASNVQVKSLDNDEFVVSDPMPMKSTFYKDPMGDTGRQVVGYLGDKSRETGVHVCVSWVDLNGDPQNDPEVFISPKELNQAS